MSSEPFSTWKNVVFHLAPGAAITAVYLIVSSFVASPIVPKALIFILSALVLIPIVYFIMKKNSASGKAMDAVAYREKQPTWKVIILGLIAFLWAALVMTAAKPLNTVIQNNVFGWMKDKFVMTDYLTAPESYPRYMLIITWAVGLLTSSTFLPIIEEYYFRGFLLKGLEKFGLGAVILSSFLFSLYHLFSPWLILTRFISLLPLTYFVWKFKDIRIGILAHVLLNIVGDSLFAIPIVFGLVR
jgi:membrane protease YdiL (CAAX protease family)